MTDDCEMTPPDTHPEGEPAHPPRWLIQPWLEVARFEYSSEDERVARLELTAELRSGVHAPVRPQLRVRRGATVSSYRPSSSSVHRRPGHRRRGASPPGLVWVASFELPVSVVEYPRAAFEIVSAERSAFSLPAPDPRLLVTPLDAVIAAMPVELRPQLHTRSRPATAFGSVVAFGAGLTVAVAVAGPDLATTAISAAAGGGVRTVPGSALAQVALTSHSSATRRPAKATHHTTTATAVSVAQPAESRATSRRAKSGTAHHATHRSEERPITPPVGRATARLTEARPTPLATPRPGRPTRARTRRRPVRSCR